jgi:hypothetical membrane protein
MNRRLIGLLGVGAWILFWLASIVFGALRPSYSPVVNTVSELGAIGTPHAPLWNVFGFVIPGFLLAVVGAAIARAANDRPSFSRTLATLLLVLSGLTVAGQGLMPAAMVNGVADITSASTRGHFISSLISGAAWALGTLLLVGPMKRNPKWRGVHVVSFVLLVLTIVASIALRGRLPDGVAERIGDAFFCGWFVVMSLKLIAISNKDDKSVDHGSTTSRLRVGTSQ